MEYRLLGKSGLKVSQICLGTMNFGDSTDAQVAASIIDGARDAGVNFIDTADGYVNGKSEEILGELIKNDRDDWVLATKVGQATGSDKRKKGLSRKWMMEAVDASLARLQTDYVDIYYMHHVDWETPLEESVAAMGDIITSGRALHWGFSNHRGWQIGELIRICDALGVPRPVICQPHYNAMMRLVETDIMPACEFYDIGVNPFSPLARGVLTGKYILGVEPDEASRAGRGDDSILKRDFRETNFKFVEAVKKQIVGRDLSVIDFAMLWLFNNKIVTSVITGPRTLEQFETYLGCIGKEFTAEDETLVDLLCASGCATSHNFVDPRYPPTGRQAIVC